MKDKEVENLKKQLTTKPSATNENTVKEGLSTGSTLLNLACTGKTHAGFLPGYYYFIVGDSVSGKSFLSLTCFAEASIHSVYKDYRYIYDNVEAGALMDVSRLFGKKAADKIEAPSKEGPSQTVEEFYYNLDDAVEQGTPFIYVLDSMDALDTEDDIDKFEQRKKARGTTKEVAGSYGTAKAKMNSAGIRKAIAGLQKTNSILLVISQTRDNIGTFSFEKKTRSGGRALRFYACLEMWSAVKEKIKKTAKGKPRQTGIVAEVKIKKNRITGQEHTVEIPIYHSFGIDDTGSMIDYLIEEKHWVGTKGKVEAKEYGYSGSIDGLISLIERDGKEKSLKMLVGGVWEEIQNLCRLDRKRRYL